MLSKNSVLKEQFHSYFLYFLVYCFVGWLYEVFVFAFEFHEGFVNRGFLFGPYLPVYGAGGLLVLFLLGQRKKEKILIGKVSVTPLVMFVCIVLLTTTVELITSYLMEMVIGDWLWDYTMDIPNFEGRIALKSSLRFGLIGIAGLYGLQPVMEKVFGALKERFPRGFVWTARALEAVFLADCVARFFLGTNYYMVK